MAGRARTKKRAPLPPPPKRRPGNGQYDPEVKERALVLIMANVWTRKMTFAQLSDEILIPSKTLQHWSKEAREAGPDRQPTPELQRMYREAHDLAVKEASVMIQERLERLADRTYEVAEMALEKVERAIKDQDELTDEERKEGLYLSRDVNGASWGKFLLQAVTGLTKTAQLLAGKPTSRQEVHERKEEYKLTVEAALGDPQVRAFARSLYRRTKGLEGGESIELTVDRMEEGGGDE